MISFQEKVSLKEYTTIHLGGTAKYFCRCQSVDDLIEALTRAKSKNLRVHVLGGGSNTIFADEGFDGIIIKVDLKGIHFEDAGSDVLIRAGAGEDWDALAKIAVEKGYSGIECLSGIPGSVGATPIQNVGAYGQEVKDTIQSVTVLDRESLQQKEFSSAECGFSYRTSRFKTLDAGKFIITEVVYRLTKNGRPTIQYPEVKKIIDASTNIAAQADGTESLQTVRSLILSLRRKKSMVIDPSDINTRSVGSFFLNPIVDEQMLTQINRIWKTIGDHSTVPTFPFGDKQKIPAAWLIEKSGFHKGYKKNGVGISENHTLALVNINGTTKTLLELAKEIQEGVQKTFQIRLELEANVIS